VLGIPIKKTVSNAMTYLDRSEVKALLNAPSPSHRFGLRDIALLSLLYNTGARASEVVDLNIVHLRLDTPPQVQILGKGRKVRVCPIWRETADAIRTYLRERDDGNSPDAPVFLSTYNKRISRFGIVAILKRHVATAAKRQPTLASKSVSPHTLRHTAAMHLLQSGVELNVIKSWLGHVSITTTSQYIEIDLAMKREALARCPPLAPIEEGESPWHHREDVIQWLEAL
jgi:site-specific recombinase XerD